MNSRKGHISVFCKVANRYMNSKLIHSFLLKTIKTNNLFICTFVHVHSRQEETNAQLAFYTSLPTKLYMNYIHYLLFVLQNVFLDHVVTVMNIKNICVSFIRFERETQLTVI